MAHIMDARMMISMRTNGEGSTTLSGHDRSRVCASEKSIVSSQSRLSLMTSESKYEENLANYESDINQISSMYHGMDRDRRNTFKRSNSAESSPVSQQANATRLAMARPNLIDLKTMSNETIEWEGYLYKQRKLVKSWTPRYITLQNGIIRVYKSKSHAIAKSPVRGSWTVKECASVLPYTGFGASKLQPETHGFTLTTTDENRIHLIAWSTLVKAMWMHAIDANIQQQDAHKEGVHIDNTQLVTSQCNLTALGEESCTRKSSSACEVPCSSASATLGMSGTAYLAHRFLYRLVRVLSCSDPIKLTGLVPSILRQLSKDTEIHFDLETAEATHPSCIFKGVYHGREGFVHFASLYQTKYLLDVGCDSKPRHKGQNHGEVHTFKWSFPKLNNVASGSVTPGTLLLRLSFTPARRICRMKLSFQHSPASPTSSRSNLSQASTINSENSPNGTRLRNKSRKIFDRTLKSVSANPMVMGEHPSCFHQAILSKRSLALSFSDFDVVGVLGQGGFGTVILVRLHHNPEELFAIKIIDKHSGAESALKERRILSGVRHPFLVCLRFAFQTQSKLYLGMDYYKGGNLYLHMHSKGSSGDVNSAAVSGKRFTCEQARFYAAEVAIALSYLHGCGIIYRDLKPDNVMLDKTGHIRLVDFGISKQLEMENDHYAPTGTLAGSPAYIAPEQLLTQKPQYGMEADWWSYGVLLYEMLTGSTPFADANISHMYRKIQTAEVKYNRHPAMDPLAVDLLQHLLVRDPTKRIGIDEIKNHPFFESIDWDRLERKDVETPFIPAATELMENVHEHFRNMNIEETIGKQDTPVKQGQFHKGFFRRKEVHQPVSHFDEFSFSYDTNRDSFANVTMADDGWLMHQLREGAVMRGKLQHTNSEDEPEIASESLDDHTAENATSEDDADSNKRVSEEHEYTAPSNSEFYT